MEVPLKGNLSGGIAIIICRVVKVSAKVTEASAEESMEPIELTIVLVVPTVPRKKF